MSARHNQHEAMSEGETEGKGRRCKLRTAASHSTCAKTWHAIGITEMHQENSQTQNTLYVLKMETFDSCMCHVTTTKYYVLTPLGHHSFNQCRGKCSATDTYGRPIAKVRNIINSCNNSTHVRHLRLILRYVSHNCADDQNFDIPMHAVTRWNS